VHLYQIWLFPERPNLTPSYEQKAFDISEQDGRLRLVASPDGREGSLKIHQDARISLGTLETGESLVHPLESGRHGWVQVVRGSIAVNGHLLAAGDGAAASDETALQIAAEQPSEIIVFDLA
jgi:redox-sensitive bicupin YhaK (pirin superfamily)